ncbi:methylmalonyl Co-A mutase-associated GTPase MeaB [Halobacterium noricense]|uniref:methylmalonyl Co-A mutase-associated GTPase MeaB n=1 Tax=Halobacterium noricense TaxID=223182 RepID=UPI001E364878|nr:methylmalonyl Co-A mutase-associated GTPase MeaB [Halobacterium noricense]UHH26878.1 methylmalonyl Co-A mutase-associated GTPase MeaB [Halobacterium noricense]
MAAQDAPDLVDELLAGKHRALARAITRIENRSPGYRDLVAALYPHTGGADVIGITGSPGSGKSTLVDKIAKAYRDRGLTVGVIAVDPSSPFTGGAVLGDRIRMASTATDMDVFFRSMSARGSLGGLSTATADAVKALDAFGKDKIIIETVGAGQNEVDVVKTADTVAVLVPPSSGDDVQMLKAGILEIGDVFVVNKADLAGSDKTVTELKNMLDMREGEPGDWNPEVVETIANSGEGVTEFLDVLDAHTDWLDESGRRETKRHQRHAEELRNLLREDASELVEDELDARGGIDDLVERIDAGETTPYEVADDVVEPLADCLDQQRG